MTLEATLARWRKTPANMTFKVDKTDYRLQEAPDQMTALAEAQEIAKEQHEEDVLKSRRIGAGMYVCEWCNDRVTHVAAPGKDVALCTVCRQGGISEAMVREGSTPIEPSFTAEVKKCSLDQFIEEARRDVDDARTNYECARIAVTESGSLAKYAEADDRLNDARHQLHASQETLSVLLRERAERKKQQREEPTMGEKGSVLGFSADAVGFRPEDRGEPGFREAVDAGPATPPSRRLGLPTRHNGRPWWGPGMPADWD